MCGILFSNDPAVTEMAFEAALELIHHRGPDASGIHVHGAARLGHRRLKIIDLDDRSNQPFWSADGRYAVIFNGEIYNYRELIRQFDLPVRTSGDTEVIVELYARRGPDFVALLDGMFAFIILDTLSGGIFAARDRLGVKPLYFRSKSGHFTFASEIAPILALSGESKWDEIGLRQYRKLRTFFNGRTLYEGIGVFPAGHTMLNGKVSRYWSLPEGRRAPPEDGELRSLIATAVHSRCLADVPVGAYLSGGLDSTIVATLAQVQHTWTVGFAQDNEFAWSRLAAARLPGTHHEIPIAPDEFIGLAREMILKRREPLSVPNEVLLYKMTRAARRESTVILAGEGADELFFGYDRIFRWAAAAPRFDLAEFDRLYSYSTQKDDEIVEDAVAPYLHLENPLEIVAAFFQVSHLHGLLRRLDHATMLCSVEARVPFAEYSPLVERMAGTPFDYRMKGGVVKAPLKRACRDLVPPEIITRPKVGFPVPLASIPFDGPPGRTPMEQWFDFNLATLSQINPLPSRANQKAS